MRIEQLQAFLVVAETGSFLKAAQKCGVNQSTISRQVQSLESELGVNLFHRGLHVKLTVGGQKFLHYAQRIARDWQNAVHDLQELQAGNQTELCVAAVHSICAYYLPAILQQFCLDYSHVQLRVTALGSDRALKVLKDGLVDLAIVMHNRYLASNAEMAVEPLFDEPIEVLMGADHPLAGQPTVTWSDLARYPHIVFKHGYGMQRIIQEELNQQGITLNAALELNTPDAFRGVVRQGQMIALLPRSALWDARHDTGLAIRPLHTNNRTLSRQISVVTTHDRLQVPPIKYFYELVTQHLARINQELVSTLVHTEPLPPDLDKQFPRQS
jgi:DNA-binding transcriptional LysR family regulator